MITPCPHCATELELDAETLAAMGDATAFACPVCQGAVALPSPPDDSAPLVIVSCDHCAGEFEVDGPTSAALQGQIEFACPICAQMLPVSMLPQPQPAVSPPASVRKPAPRKRTFATSSNTMSPSAPNAPLGTPSGKATAKAHRKMNRNLLILGSAALLTLGGLGFFLASRPTGTQRVEKIEVVSELVKNKFFQDLIAAGKTNNSSLLEVAKVKPNGKGYVGFSNGKLTWEEARKLAGQVGAEIVAMEGTPERSARQLAEWLTGEFPSLHGSTVWVRQQGREKMCDLPDVLPVTSLLRRRHALFEWKIPEPIKLPRWQAPDGAVFVTIPSGLFEMGDALDGDGNAPVIRVTVNPFRLQTTETTKAQWDDVRVWALMNGYTDLPEGEGKAATHPVQKVNWHDVVKWLNARSEMHQLKPCYSAAGAVYRTGMAEAVSCDWEADGYRLPTEAEWERAARGPSFGRRYPWGYTISHREANFRNDGRESYRFGTPGFHPNHRGTKPPSTSPVATFPANDFGLFDVAGNVWEWCWDWYDRKYYQDSDGTTDPRGPEIGDHRVLRGGSWYSHAYYTRCAIRIWLKPDSPLGNRGFRAARRDGGGQGALVPLPAMDIALIKVTEPATLSEKGEITMPAKAGEKFRIEVTAIYRTPVPTKLASNLLMKDAGILPPNLLAELQKNHATSWHFDTESRPGYGSVNGAGSITFDLTGYAPLEAGNYSFNLNLGLFDKATWATKILKLHKVNLVVTQ